MALRRAHGMHHDADLREVLEEKAEAETPGLSGSSYVESLKIKIQTLETQLWEERLQDTTPSRRAYNSPRDQDDTQQRTNVPGSSDVVDHPNGDLHDTIEEASYLSLAAMGAQRADHQPFPTQGLSFLTLLYAATGVSGTNPSTSQGNHAAHSAILAGLRNNVVVPHYEQSRTVNSAALDKYIEFVQQSYPFIASGGLRDVFKIALQTQQDDRDATTVDAEQPETTVIMLFGLATGLLVSPGYAYTEVIATKYAACAVDLLPRVFDHTSDLSTVQCLVALTIYSLYTALGGSTWHLLGLAMTRCVASGMHISSTALDRPFCLSDNDVLVSSPTSTEISNDNRRLRCLVEHAQLPRSNRSEPTTDPWVQYINLRHWYDIMDTPAAPSLSHLQMLVHGLIEIVNRISFQNSQNWNLILCGAEPDIENYLNLLETQLLEQRCAPAAFDAFDVFAAGVMIMQLRMQITARIAARKSLVSQAINVLTMLSMRYPPIRSLRDVLSEYRAISIDNQQHLSLSHLRDLIDRSEICIPRPLQDMILRGFTP
ncbi:hypothetical protein COCC4DRAFT_57589 [Bipolaris maydis ATCC 48331]|uniref:Transcription factor domain-containing protein n=2 Tax=Cochliobolus heterostrophus TaxID=5016 RepID=M2UU62_COCH5|nr:uncharacterized protein COCC4DRAFT_57589 [Bipolaris maydis ATCC 48331]EMD91378.1 hypothetical protein COCHEDRAFT_1155759 [Bipolaris maydis C5]ENI08862.1 hypothetical protein COCC4DRAFT_57589 [Bipolaris maydis ATCC 48331]KAJ5027422.1 hypothetical protein J3E73DRAFT_390525 [Bipolaris maydis]KAJ6208779.1 hypothetical protein PSV09DRAFT_1155759 [Bipolaris maydis]